MKHPIPFFLLLAACLVLPACGDGDSGGAPTPEDMGLPTDFDPNDPQAVRDAVTGFSRSVASAELTDEVMANLFEVHQQLQDAEDDSAKALAIFRASNWNVGTYTKAMMKFEALRSAKRRGVEKMQQEYEEAKGELAKIEARVAAATGEEKAALEQQLSMMKMMLPSLEQHAQVAAQLKDPQVRALVEKWSAKFDALEGE